MSVRNFNNLTTIGTLVAPIAASVTTISVQSFSQSPPTPYTVTLDRNLATEEICLVTAQAGGSLTVVRGFDGTAAQSHTAGATIEHTAGAIEYSEANSHVNATVGVHGTTGALVGAEGAQSVFDKTLIAPLMQADVADGDAVVAYDPTGTRNLFRGMNQAGTDVITVDNTGKVNAGALAVTGTSTLTGPLNANGGVTVPAGKTVTASGGVSTTTVTASGAISGTTITGTGLVKGAGVESTAGLSLAQIAAPAGVASKGQLWSQSDGGLYTRAGATAAATRLPVHWGSGTTFPASPLTGDTFTHTGMGAYMRWNGGAWRQVEPPEVANDTARVAISTTYSAQLYPGFRVRQADIAAMVEWDGSRWIAVAWDAAWGYDLDNTSYNYPVTTTSSQVIPGGGPFNVSVLPGRTLDLEFTAGQVNFSAAGGTLYSSLALTPPGGSLTIVDGGFQSAVSANLPLKLTGSWQNTTNSTQTLAFQVQATAAAAGTVTLFSGSFAGGHVRLRHRNS